MKEPQSAPAVTMIRTGFAVVCLEPGGGSVRCMLAEILLPSKVSV